jgi:hypothetical protein
MAIVMTVTPIVVPTIDDNAVIMNGAAEENRFPPVREYLDTFQFSAAFADDSSNDIAYTVIGISYTPSLTGITTSFSNNSINISGNIQNVFTNKQFQFRMNDGSIQQLSANTSESFYGVIKYQADNRRYVEVTYTIILSTDGTSNNENPASAVTFIAKQTVNNDWESDRLLLKQLVSRGH